MAPRAACFVAAAALELAAATIILRQSGQGKLADICGGLPLAPDYDHGRFNSQHYDISSFALAPNGNYRSLVPIMEKLRSGRSVRIMALGGPETAGTGCHQLNVVVGQPRLENQLCSWPARVGQWLETAFPGADVTVLNKASGGTTTRGMLAGLGLVLRGADAGFIDLIFIDTLVNDAYEAASVGSLSREDSVAAAYEQLILAVQEVVPNTPMMSLLAGCPSCHVMKPYQQKVLDHYSVPYVDFSAMVQEAPQLWDLDGSHPSFKSHQTMSDAMTTFLAHAWELGCGQASIVALRSDMLASKDILDTFGFCGAPISYYSAKDEAGPQPDLKGDWKLYEDRPGKPGWISEQGSSVITFPLKFGSLPSLTVSYLRSYDRLGTARLTMNGRSFIMDGLWPLDFADEVSQTFTQYFSASANEMQQADFATAGVNGFGVAPNSEYNMTIELLPDDSELPRYPHHRQHVVTKMKLLEVTTC